MLYNSVNASDSTSNLPIISIDTRGDTITYLTRIRAGCRIIDNGPGELNRISDRGNAYDGDINLKYRGQSSLEFPKKSMNLETIGNEGSDIDVPLLGMSAEEDWVLYAPYSDKSLLRNAIAYHLGAKMGRWQPGFRFCTVYINNVYMGIYMLTEKIKRDESRVNIAALNPYETGGDDLTGGYIFKVDKMDFLGPDDYFIPDPVIRYSGDRNYNFTYVVPEADEIAPEQKQYLNKYLTDFQNMLNSSHFNSLQKGYQKYIDVYSFVDYQLIQELTGNVDAYRYSVFFYKSRDSDGGKLFAGPLWDYDIALGNINFFEESEGASGWHYDNNGPNVWNCMHWWKRLMEDITYANTVAGRWKKIRQGPLSNDSIMAFIDGSVDHLGDEVSRNFSKWPILGIYVWPNNFIGNTYEEEIDYVKSWISARLEWMDQNIEATPDSFAGGYDKEIRVYPNPARDIVNIMFRTGGTGNMRLDLADQAGRIVMSSSFPASSDSYNMRSMDISNLPSGIYLVIVYHEGRMEGKNYLIKIR